MKLTVLMIAFLLGWYVGAAMHKVYAADLLLPAKHYPEACLEPGKEPAPGQTLHTDKRCKSGMRWVYQR